MNLKAAWLWAWICFACNHRDAIGTRPQFDTSTDMGLVLVPADAEVDSVIFRLRATDQDADFPLIFDITAAVQPIVRIVNLPCTLYNNVCQANVILTRRLVPGRLHDFAVRVKDSKGDSNSMQATISVTNATTPRETIFPHVPSIIMVPEDTKPGKELDYLLVRANPWSGKPVYIELWQPKELFTIRQRYTSTETRGIITLTGELDFETQSMYTLMMYATDPYTEPGKDTRNIAGIHVVVVVQDVQDVPPVFTLAPPLTRVNNSIKPGDVILRVHAEDGDKGSPRGITYGLVSENKPFTPFFNISESTGEIILAKPLEELTRITHVGAPVLLTIVAEEIRRSMDEPPAQSTEVELGLLLGEPGNSPPYFESSSYVTWMDENAAPGTILTFDEEYSTRVLDEDLGKTGVFALKLENNNGTFEVTPAVAERATDFVLTVRNNSLIDYETTKSLSFSIVAQEVGPATNLSASAHVTVFLRDTNDNAPEFDKDSYESTLFENVPAGTRVVQVQAVDKDTGVFGSVRYTRLLGPGSDALTMDPNSGSITVATGAILDREQTPSLNLSVEARDENGKGLSSLVSLVVNLIDVNDNAPIFEKTVYEFALNADRSNFSSPAFVKAVDADAEPPNNEVRYELIYGNYENKFHLNEITGELTIRRSLNNGRRTRHDAYAKFGTKFRNQFLQVQKTFERLSVSTDKPLRIWKNRKKRAEEEALFTLTIRAYDLGVPHRSSTTQVRVTSGVSAAAREVMFVVPGEHPDRARTTETLETITGGRVTIKDIRPYNQTGNGSDPGSKKSIVVAMVEQNAAGTSFVDIENIRKSLAANGVGIIAGMETKTDAGGLTGSSADGPSRGPNKNNNEISGSGGATGVAVGDKQTSVNKPPSGAGDNEASGSTDRASSVDKPNSGAVPGKTAGGVDNRSPSSEQGIGDKSGTRADDKDSGGAGSGTNGREGNGGTSGGTRENNGGGIDGSAGNAGGGPIGNRDEGVNTGKNTGTSINNNAGGGTNGGTGGYPNKNGSGGDSNGSAGQGTSGGTGGDFNGNSSGSTNVNNNVGGSGSPGGSGTIGSSGGATNNGAGASGGTGSGNSGGATDGEIGAGAGEPVHNSVAKTPVGSGVTFLGPTGVNSNSINKTVVTGVQQEEVIVYKAENRLLLWLLILLGLLMLGALLALILCCICPGCPFYMAPRKRRVHSYENVLRTDGRPQRHVRRKQGQQIHAEWMGKKQAWSADPTRTNWQFNKRNTKNRGLASLPGDVAAIHHPYQISNTNSLRLRDGPALREQAVKRREDQLLYVEDVEMGRGYDPGDVDSLRRHEMERGSDVPRQSYRYVEEDAVRPPREQHFYRDGNAEVLRLVTRGHVEAEENAVRGHRPVTLINDQQGSQGYRIDGKDILLRRFMEDQALRQQQDIHGSVPEIHVDSYDTRKQAGERMQRHELVLVPRNLEHDRVHLVEQQQQAGSVQRLIIDHPEYEAERKLRGQQLAMQEDDDVQQQRKAAAAMMVGAIVAQATEKSMTNAPAYRHREQVAGISTNIPISTSRDLELARQNALLTQLLADRDPRSFGIAGLDASSYLETQSLPGQVAIATQTDRTTATQTDNYNQVRSRSDNDESEEEAQSRKKTKSKRRFGTEIVRSRSLLLKSPIEEESRGNESRSSLLRRKAKDAKSGRRATLETEVLREISDSLEDRTTTPSADEDQLKKIRKTGVARNIDYDLRNNTELDEQLEERVPSSPDTSKDKYHRRSHANTSINDVLQGKSVVSTNRKIKTVERKSSSRSRNSEAKSGSKNKSLKHAEEENSVEDDALSRSMRKTMDIHGTTSNEADLKRITNERRRYKIRMESREDATRLTPTEASRKSKIEDTDESLLLGKRTLVKQQKTTRMSTESSELEDTTSNKAKAKNQTASTSEIRQKQAAPKPTKSSGASDEAKSRSSETGLNNSSKQNRRQLDSASNGSTELERGPIKPVIDNVMKSAGKKESLNEESQKDANLSPQQLREVFQSSGTENIGGMEKDASTSRPVDSHPKLFEINLSTPPVKELESSIHEVGDHSVELHPSTSSSKMKALETIVVNEEDAKKHQQIQDDHGKIKNQAATTAAMILPEAIELAQQVLKSDEQIGSKPRHSISEPAIAEPAEKHTEELTATNEELKSPEKIRLNPGESTTQNSRTPEVTILQEKRAEKIGPPEEVLVPRQNVEDTSAQLTTQTAMPAEAAIMKETNSELPRAREVLKLDENAEAEPQQSASKSAMRTGTALVQETPSAVVVTGKEELETHRKNEEDSEQAAAQDEIPTSWQKDNESDKTLVDKKEEISQKTPGTPGGSDKSEVEKRGSSVAKQALECVKIIVDAEGSESHPPKASSVISSPEKQRDEILIVEKIPNTEGNAEEKVELPDSKAPISHKMTLPLEQILTASINVGTTEERKNEIDRTQKSEEKYPEKGKSSPIDVPKPLEVAHSPEKSQQQSITAVVLKTEPEISTSAASKQEVTTPSGKKSEEQLPLAEEASRNIDNTSHTTGEIKCNVLKVDDNESPEKMTTESIIKEVPRIVERIINRTEEPQVPEKNKDDKKTPNRIEENDEKNDNVSEKLSSEPSSKQQELRANADDEKYSENLIKNVHSTSEVISETIPNVPVSEKQPEMTTRDAVRSFLDGEIMESSKDLQDTARKLDYHLPSSIAAILPLDLHFPRINSDEQNDAEKPKIADDISQHSTGGSGDDLRQASTASNDPQRLQSDNKKHQQSKTEEDKFQPNQRMITGREDDPEQIRIDKQDDSKETKIDNRVRLDDTKIEGKMNVERMKVDDQHDAEEQKCSGTEKRGQEKEWNQEQGVSRSLAEIYGESDTSQRDESEDLQSDGFKGTPELSRSFSVIEHPTEVLVDDPFRVIIEHPTVVLVDDPFRVIIEHPTEVLADPFRVIDQEQSESTQDYDSNQTESDTQLDSEITVIHNINTEPSAPPSDSPVQLSSSDHEPAFQRIESMAMKAEDPPTPRQRSSMVSPENVKNDSSTSHDRSSTESPPFYVLSNSSSTEGESSAQSSGPENSKAAQVSDEKLVVPPLSNLDNEQAPNDDHVLRNAAFPPVSIIETIDNAEPYQTPRHKSKPNSNDNAMTMNVVVPTIASLSSHTEDHGAIHSSIASDAKDAGTDSMVSDRQLTPRLIAEEAIRTGLREVMTDSAISRKASIKQKSTKMPQEAKTTKEAKATAESKVTEKKVSDSKKVAAKVRSKSFQSSKNSKNTPADASMPRPKTEPKDVVESAKDSSATRPKTQRGRPVDSRLAKPRLASRASSTSQESIAAVSPPKKTDTTVVRTDPIPKEGHMSRYKQKREEMERKRREQKELAEAEGKPRWQRKSPPQAAPGPTGRATGKDTRKGNAREASKERNRGITKEATKVEATDSKTSDSTTPKTRRKVKPLENPESEQLREIIKQGRKMRKTEEGDSDDPPVEIFASEPPTKGDNDDRQHPGYTESPIPFPFYLHLPPPVPNSSPAQLSPNPGSAEFRRPDDDLDSGIAVSLQGGTRPRHQQLLEKKSVFDIAYNEAAPSHLRSDSTTPPS